jgi:hypothetical protein
MKQLFKPRRNPVFSSFRHLPLVNRGIVALRNLGLFIPREEGPLSVARSGHREYVGGDWDRMGRLQFEFMLNHGLQESDVFLDVGCGSLRGGVHFIRYLKCGHYLGLEREEGLIKEGLQWELGDKMLRQRAPEFVISDHFEFHKFSKQPTFALAQSLFSHLSPDDIQLCLKNLRTCAFAGCAFYATFFECARPQENYSKSHSHLSFYYTRLQMETFGQSQGWKSSYMGNWSHPGGQVMIEYAAL